MPAGAIRAATARAQAKPRATELGPVDVKTPRDRNGTFEPLPVAKRQTRLAGLDDKILDLSGAGCRRAISRAHLRSLYGTTAIGRDTIRVTDAVRADVARQPLAQTG